MNKRQKRVPTNNPFWTDMSETGIARRKKVMRKVKERIERSATPPPTHCLRSSNKFAARLTGDPKDQCY